MEPKFYSLNNQDPQDKKSNSQQSYHNGYTRYDIITPTIDKTHDNTWNHKYYA